jgi:alpha-amylase
MDILADYEKECILTDPDKKEMYPLRSMYIEDAFYFSSPYGYTGHVAFDLDHFVEMLSQSPADSIEYHHQQGDFVHWAKNVVGDEPLAQGLQGATCRQDLIYAADTRRKELWDAKK